MAEVGTGFDILDEMSSELECELCLDEPTDPRILPCGHGFCSKCLFDIISSQINSQPGSIRCPKCRGEHSLPSSGVSQLPKDSRVNSLVDLKNKCRQMTEQRFRYCTDCTDKFVTATYFCVECEKVMCVQCKEKHSSRRAFHDHKVLHVDESHIEDLLCVEHGDRYVTCFCVTCGGCICSACIIEHHASHDRVNLQSCIPDNPEHSGIHTQVTIQQKECQARKSDLVARKNHNKKQLQEIKSIISNCANQYIERAKQREQYLLNTVDELDQENKTQYAVQKSIVDDKMAILEKFSSLGKDWKIPMKSQPAITHSAKMPLTAFQEEFSCIHIPDTLPSGFSFEKAPESPFPLLGEIIERPKVFAVIGDICEKQGIELLWQCSTGTSKGYLQDICCIDAAKQIFLCSVNLDTDRQRLEMIEAGQIKKLPDAFPSTKKSYYRLGYNPSTDTMAIHVSDVDDHTVILFKGLKRFTEFPGQPRAHSIHPSNDGKIFITTSTKDPDNTYSCIYCYSPCGEILWIKEIHAAAEGRCISPYYLTEDQIGRLIVSDYHGHQVNIYTADGKHLHAFPSPGNDDINPMCAVVDDRNNIIVGLDGRRTVSMFDPSGVFLRHILELDGKPAGMCLVGDKLLVGTFCGDIILYDIRNKLAA